MNVRVAGMAMFFASIFPLAPLGLAQQLFPKHYINLGPGLALPRGEINQYFATRPGLTVNYNYRFHRYLQADAGYDVVFGAGQVREFLQTQLGTLRIRDFQHFVPLGGRGVIPLADGRVLISGGGGAVWMRYSDSLRQPNNFIRFACPPCQSRSGWGSYGLVNVKFTNRWQRIWFGFTTKVIRGTTDGQPFANLPATRTKDQWVNSYFELGFGF